MARAEVFHETESDPRRSELIALLSADFSSRGIRFHDLGLLSSSKEDQLINADTVGARVDELLREGKDESFLKEETHHGQLYEVDHEEVAGGSRKTYVLVDDASLAPEDFRLATEVSLNKIFQGQDTSLTVIRYTNNQSTIDVCTVVKGKIKDEGIDTRAFVGRIPWDNGYKAGVATAFGLKPRAM